MVIIDTNIIIDHLRKRGVQKVSLLNKFVKHSPEEKFSISVITIQELYEGRSTRDSLEEEFLLATISPLNLLPYNFETAELAGKIARDLGKQIEFADAAIAAATIINGGELLTLNKKDFSGIKDLILV